MADAVVKLAARDDVYRAEVVAKLEDLLAAARRGEILSIVYACDRPGGAVTTGSTRVKDRFMLLGYLTHQIYLTNQSIDGDSVSSDLGQEDA